MGAQAGMGGLQTLPAVGGRESKQGHELFDGCPGHVVQQQQQARVGRQGVQRDQERRPHLVGGARRACGIDGVRGAHTGQTGQRTAL